jgi:hypothetical protein
MYIDTRLFLKESSQVLQQLLLSIGGLAENCLSIVCLG